MLRVVLYSIDYSEGLLRRLPYVQYFAERSLCHLADLRSPEHRIVLVTPRPVEPELLTYHFRDLFGMDARQERSARDRLVLLSPKSAEPRPLAELVLREAALMRRLKAEVSAAGNALLVNFTPSGSVEILGRKLGVPVEEGPYPKSRYWGSKSGSKEAFARCGVAAPRGTSTVFWSIDDIAQAATRLATMDPPARHVIVKLNDASWGDAIGNAVVDCAALLRTGCLRSSVQVMLQPWDDFVCEVLKGGAIVEEYLADTTSSPSGQGYIATDGRVVVRSTHEQLVVSGQYLGCAFPGRDELVLRVRQMVAQVGECLRASGVRGTYGVDFVSFSDGLLLATEINARKVGPSHVLSYVESVVGACVADDGYLRAPDGTGVCYLHRRCYVPDRLRHFTAHTILAFLRERGLLYDHVTKRGVLLHILGALGTCGYLETTCLAENSAAAAALDERVQSALLGS